MPNELAMATLAKVICCSPVPSERMRQRSMLPLVWRPNTIHWPFGEREISASKTPWYRVRWPDSVSRTSSPRRYWRIVGGQGHADGIADLGELGGRHGSLPM
jgi:hypothetical protein